MHVQYLLVYAYTYFLFHYNLFFQLNNVFIKVTAIRKNMTLSISLFYPCYVKLIVLSYCCCFLCQTNGFGTDDCALSSGEFEYAPLGNVNAEDKDDWDRGDKMFIFVKPDRKNEKLFL